MRFLFFGMFVICVCFKSLFTYSGAHSKDEYLAMIQVQIEKYVCDLIENQIWKVSIFMLIVNSSLLANAHLKTGYVVKI